MLLMTIKLHERKSVNKLLFSCWIIFSNYMFMYLRWQLILGYVVIGIGESGNRFHCAGTFRQVFSLSVCFFFSLCHMIMEREIHIESNLMYFFFLRPNRKWQQTSTHHSLLIAKMIECHDSSKFSHLAFVWPVDDTSMLQWRHTFDTFEHSHKHFDQAIKHWG